MAATRTGKAIVTRRLSFLLLIIPLFACGVTEPDGPMTLRMEGIVFDAVTGQPIAHATVAIGHGATGCGAGKVQDFGAEIVSTNAAGVYSHRYDHPCQVPFREDDRRNCGGISFSASAPGYATALSPTPIRCVAGVQRIDFALSAGEP